MKMEQDLHTKTKERGASAPLSFEVKRTLY